jgi:hypothetical protein
MTAVFTALPDPPAVERSNEPKRPAQAQPPASSGPGEYDSELLDRLLKNWDDLTARAEHMRSPSAYDVARPAPTRGRFHQGSAAEMLADIERAVERLPSGLGRDIISELMHGQGRLSLIALRLLRRKADVYASYKTIRGELVSLLNGTDEPSGAGGVVSAIDAS